jgi:hypothetical protein
MLPLLLCTNAVSFLRFAPFSRTVFCAECTSSPALSHFFHLSPHFLIAVCVSPHVHPHSDHALPLFPSDPNLKPGHVLVAVSIGFSLFLLPSSINICTTTLWMLRDSATPLLLDSSLLFSWTMYLFPFVNVA